MSRQNLIVAITSRLLAAPATFAASSVEKFRNEKVAVAESTVAPGQQEPAAKAPKMDAGAFLQRMKESGTGDAKLLPARNYVAKHPDAGILELIDLIVAAGAPEATVLSSFSNSARVICVLQSGRAAEGAEPAAAFA